VSHLSFFPTPLTPLVTSTSLVTWFLPCSRLESLRSNNYRNFIRIIITKRRGRRARWSSTDPTNTPGEGPSSPPRQLGSAKKTPDPPRDIKSATDLARRTGGSEGSVGRRSRLASCFEIADSPPRRFTTRTLRKRKHTGVAHKSWQRASPYRDRIEFDYGGNSTSDL